MPMYGCKTFVGYQIIGCYLVLVGYMFYSARPHILRIWQAASILDAATGRCRGRR